MTLEMIETIRKLAESHDFKGVPIPQLCKMAARYAWLRDIGDHTFVPFDKRTAYSGKALDEWIDEAISNAAQHSVSKEK